jgi:peptidoglycan/LPS O-acetylase OafA/YrhL
MSALGPTWSLAVEEQFYLVWPVLLYFMLRLKLSPRRMMTLVCLGIVACVVLRMYIYSLHRSPGPEKLANIDRLYMGSDTRADALLVGCLTALIATFGMLPTSRSFRIYSGVGAFLSVVALGLISYFRCYDHSQFYHGLFTAVAAMVALIIVRLLLVSDGIGAKILEWSPLVGVGRISYALYLIHMPLIYWFDLQGRLGWHYPLNTLLVGIASIGLAIASYYCIERPFLRLKGRCR